MNASASRSAAPITALRRTLVLVGLMGAGKSSIGKRLAARIGAPFTDADTAIEEAAGSSIADIFAQHGEAAFRDGERKVIARLLELPPHVLATGGGAFMDGETRSRIKLRGFSIWLRADLEVLMRRVQRRNNERPLLRDGDPRETMARLMAERYPVYAEADLIVDTADAPHVVVVDEIMARISALPNVADILIRAEGLPVVPASV